MGREAGFLHSRPMRAPQAQKEDVRIALARRVPSQVVRSLFCRGKLADKMWCLAFGHLAAREVACAEKENPGAATHNLFLFIACQTS